MKRLVSGLLRYLGPPLFALVVGVVVGVAAADETDEIAVRGVDGEHEPVAESVDEPAGAGAGGQPGGEQFGVGGVGVVAEVVGEVGPAGRGVAGQEGAAGQVGVQPFGDVVGGPAGGVVGDGSRPGRRG